MVICGPTWGRQSMSSLFDKRHRPHWTWWSLSASGIRRCGSEFMTQEFEIKQARLYQLYLSQVDEVNRHKWIESEKAGFDVGWDWALVNWIIHYRANWIRQHVNH